MGAFVLTTPTAQWTLSGAVEYGVRIAEAVGRMSLRRVLARGDFVVSIEGGGGGEGGGEGEGVESEHMLSFQRLFRCLTPII